MGYRSDVAFMAVFLNAEQHDEVMAIYRMDKRVQEYDLANKWRRVDRDDSDEVILIYEDGDVKWYDHYDDVQGVEYLQELLETFVDEREFSFAWGAVCIGSEGAEDHTEEGGEHGGSLCEIVHDNLSLSQSIKLDL
jgi:hypothetical protein